MNEFSQIYRGRRVLLTGHTGFKGSWLALWLTRLGANVTGVALPPETSPSHWDLLSLDMPSHFVDIRNRDALAQVISSVKPELVFHLAAQPLVRLSYREPVETWSTNVMGTVNLLDCCRQTESVQGVLVVTSDKCYQNREWVWGYREDDSLGGHDPYSASKAATELVVESFRKSFFHATAALSLASARAGNVIGGGDWSEDRLIPDIVRAVTTNATVDIRSPSSTRPWQHVLESLSGYLLLGQHLLSNPREAAQAWNFGPTEEGNRSVQTVMENIAEQWPSVRWQISDNASLHEARLLYLDSTKARTQLHWQPAWGFREAITATVDWYRAFLNDKAVISNLQLEQYVQAATQARLSWTTP